MFEGDLIWHRTPIFKFCILHATDYFVQDRSSTRARTLSSFSRKFTCIFKIIQDQYFDITLIIDGSFYFQGMESHQPNKQVTPFGGMRPTG
jgi:hypothetical protein